ncbi:uncharacterized protein METZ01_LOCUS78670 [marine metagenome]|uniref:Bacteriophage head to tail connecting protein n=1 Tax=marine metagenome TaxID=408172 RepID=A0A381UC78_9ZZZZ
MAYDYGKDVKSIIKRYETLKEDRILWEPFFRDVRDYIRPRKQNVDSSTHVSAERHTNKMFDSSAPEASRLMAMSMQNALVPQSVVWFGLSIPSGHPLSVLNKEPDVKRWFHDVTQKMFFAMHESNFYTAIGESFLDFTSFGTINLLLEEDDSYDGEFGGLVFTSIPTGQYVFAEDKRGRPDTVFWEYTFTARQAKQMFGQRRLPDKIKKACKEKPDEKFTFVRVLMPRDDYRRGSQDVLEKRFASVDIALDARAMVRESGFDELPYVIGRFEKASGELWGRSPADIAMPDIKTLNKIRELELKGLATAVHPPLIAPDQGIIGTFRMTPSAINYSREPERFKFLRFEGRFDLSSLKANDLKKSIRGIFLADQLVLPEKLNMTAEEVATVREQIQKLLGPTVARFESEVLTPLILRSFGLMSRAGILPPAPPALQELDEIEVAYVGQLAKNQKIQDVTSIQRWLGVAANMASFSPEVLDNIDVDEALQIIGERMAVPNEIMRSQEEVAQLREQRQQQMQMQEELAQASQVAEGAGKVAPMVKALGGVDAFPVQ